MRVVKMKLFWASSIPDPPQEHHQRGSVVGGRIQPDRRAVFGIARPNPDQHEPCNFEKIPSSRLRQLPFRRSLKHHDVEPREQQHQHQEAEQYGEDPYRAFSGQKLRICDKQQQQHAERQQIVAQ